MYILQIKQTKIYIYFLVSKDSIPLEENISEDGSQISWRDRHLDRHMIMKGGTCGALVTLQVA